MRSASPRRNAQRAVLLVTIIALLSPVGTTNAASKARAKLKTTMPKRAVAAAKRGQTKPVDGTAKFSLQITDWLWEPTELPRLAIAWSSFGPALNAIEFTATPAEGKQIVVQVPKPKDVLLVGLNPFMSYRLEAVPLWEGYGAGVTTTVNIPAAASVAHPKIAHPEGLKSVALTGARPNPCLALHWRYNAARETFDALPQITDAVATLTQATGIEAIYDGPTTEYEIGVGEYDPTKADIEHPRTWMLVQWEDPSRPVRSLGDGEKNSVLGIGSPGIQRAKPGLPEEFADGSTLSLRNTRTALTAEEFRSTLLHELGHTVGLDHVNDETSIMYPLNKGITNYSPRDLAALAALGRPGSGGCIG